ncbi:MAG: hypothetical protein Q8M16_17995 [Pirellulaceae bacterium]|nr:hypothetical protein [Pirellulaceae bacterium]
MIQGSRHCGADELRKDARTAHGRSRDDGEFRNGLLAEALEAVVRGELSVAKILLRDYINATEGFESVENAINKSPKSLMRIEPYPKSLVNELYPDSIRIEDGECGAFVSFVPFVGVAPRRYQDVFKVGEINRKSLVKYATGWKAEVASPRLGEHPSRTQRINIVAEQGANSSRTTVVIKFNCHGHAPSARPRVIVREASSRWS